jgi:ATP-dependent RNA helicase DDX46/PRP5
LDVKDLGLVINYECPNHMEDYVHRVGRTGRAGNKGTAITFITKEQERFAPDIVKALKTSNVPIPKELEILSESFMSKVRSGEAQSAGSGFGGKGLERIDEERAALRKSQKRAFGAEEEDEEEEVTNNLEELSDKTIKSAKEAQEKPPVSTTQVTSTIKPQKHKQAESMPNAIKTAQLAAAQIASKVAALNPKTQNNTDALTAINARFKPPSNSPAAQGEIQPMFEPKQLGEDSANVPSVIRGYCCEIEINDYPQNARWKITNRDTVSSIIDYSETSIVVRGLFFPPGKVPRDTERRLHLRIEGSTEVSVEKARAEVQRILVEATMEAAERGTIDYSRYNL